MRNRIANLCRRTWNGISDWYKHNGTFFAISISIWTAGLILITFFVCANILFHTAWEAILALATWVLAYGALLAYKQIAEAKQSSSTQLSPVSIAIFVAPTT